MKKHIGHFHSTSTVLYKKATTAATTTSLLHLTYRMTTYSTEYKAQKNNHSLSRSKATQKTGAQHGANTSNSQSTATQETNAHWPANTSTS